MSTHDDESVDRSRHAARILYCRRCRTGYGSVGEVPRTCPACGHETAWTYAPPAPDGPRLLLTPEDRRFLRSFRIAADD